MTNTPSNIPPAQIAVSLDVIPSPDQCKVVVLIQSPAPISAEVLASALEQLAGKLRKPKLDVKKPNLILP